MSTIVLYYFQNVSGDSAETPNAFSIPNSPEITLGIFLKYFPVKDANLHFRFKTEDKSYDYVWSDIKNANQKLPTYKSMVFVKILRLDDVHLLKQKMVLRRKLMAGSSAVAAQANQQVSEKLKRASSEYEKQQQEIRNAPPRSESNLNNPIHDSSPAKPFRPAPSSGSVKLSPPPAAPPSPAPSPVPPAPVPDFMSFGSDDGVRSGTSGKSAKPSASSSSPTVGIDEERAAPKSRETLVAEREADTQQRVNDALANKRTLDASAAKEADEVEQARLKHDKNLLAWATDKNVKRNIRTLLSTMHTVLWPDNKWKPIGLGDVLEPKGIKLQYRKAMLVVHPDRCSHLDAETTFIAKRVFEAINEAYDVFLEKEGLN